MHAIRTALLVMLDLFFWDSRSLSVAGAPVSEFRVSAVTTLAEVEEALPAIIAASQRACMAQVSMINVNGEVSKSVHSWSLFSGRSRRNEIAGDFMAGAARALVLLVLAIACSQPKAEEWPAETPGTNIGAGIANFNAGFEASGLTYHDTYGYLVVGDDGDIAAVQEDGTVSAYQMLGGDFEGIAIKSGAAMLAYVASENLNAILELSLSTLTLTGNNWALQLPQSGGLGFEGITFVPSEHAPSAWGNPCCAGFFVAGTQADSALRVFDVDTSANADSALASVASIPTDYGDVSGLHFSVETGLLYVLHDAANQLTEMTLDGTKVHQYETPLQAAEEGVVLVPDCASGLGVMGLVDDGGPVVMRHSGFPLACSAVSNTAELPPAALWLLIRKKPDF